MSAGTWWLIAGYVGLTGFFVLEAVTRQRGSASSLETSREDEGTTRLIGIAYVTAAWLAPLLHYFASGALPLVVAPIGLVVLIAGVLLRGWSMRVLGRFYSRTLRVDGEHSVVGAGPYSVIRHPGYAASLLIWTGFALTTTNLVAVVVVVALLAFAYQRRISAEERLLVQDLPGYAAYRGRTSRLIPHIW